MAITEAIENYLETILVLSKMQPDVHAIDICSYMGYSRPTVSIVLKKMKEQELVNVDEENHITLTNEGKTIADQVLERHNVVSKLLMLLGVDKDTALNDACKIEHDISPATFEALKNCYARLMAENSDAE